MKISQAEFEKIAQDAEDAMWAVVAMNFPPDTPGDFPPDMARKLTFTIKLAVETWISTNVEGVRS